MVKELSIRAVHNGGMRVSAGDGIHSVNMDYPLRDGEDVTGLTPLQMLMASLAACAANTLMLVLKGRMKQPVAGLEVIATGKRREAHPTGLTEIALEFLVKGTEVDPEAVEKALIVAEQEICPVWAMLKPGTTITSSYRIFA